MEAANDNDDSTEASFDEFLECLGRCAVVKYVKEKSELHMKVKKFLTLICDARW